MNNIMLFGLKSEKLKMLDIIDPDILALAPVDGKNISVCPYLIFPEKVKNFY